MTWSIRSWYLYGDFSNEWSLFRDSECRVTIYSSEVGYLKRYNKKAVCGFYSVIGSSEKC